MRVGAALEGSVRRAGDRVRVTAQLVDADNGYQLWSQRFDRELSDIFAIQDEIAAIIVTELRLELAGRATTTRAAIDVTAHDAACIAGSTHAIQIDIVFFSRFARGRQRPSCS